MCKLKKILFISTFILLPGLLFAQNKSIKGKVTDADGEPLIGVNIIIKGTTTGTVSDFEGNYTISNLNSEIIEIEASFIGYLPETYRVNLTTVDEANLNIVLLEDIKEISEVVVIGYGTTKKSDLTGAVSTVNSEDLNDRAVPSIDQALQGKVAGVDITSNSGSPGASPTIRIRGVGTINNSDPIFVVDGLIISPEAINFLNPNDIENISVLKDASATAIYGSKGANGVIMITTKKGKKGDFKVNLNTYIGTQKIAHWMSLMNGPEWAKAKNASSFMGDIYDPDTVGTTNWLDEISQTALMKSTNISISGGSDKATFLLSYGLFDQAGVIKRTNYKRHTLRVNADYNVKKWLKVGQNLQVAVSNRDFVEEENWYHGVVARAIAADPITPVRGTDGEYAALISGNGNPVARMEEGLLDENSKNSKLVGNLFAEFSIIEGLTFKSTFGGELSVSEFKRHIPAYYYGPGDASNFPQLYQNFGKNIYWQWENYATYTKTLGLHDFTVMAGTSHSASEFYNLTGQNKIGPTNDSEALEYFDNFSREGDVLGGSANQAANASFLGRLNYKLMNRYLLTASYRRDGSSNFGADYKYGNFTSFALAWKIKEEVFLQDVAFISKLKLRAGWGEIGNDKTDYWPYVGLVTSNLNYSEGDELKEGATTLKAANQSLHWETTRQGNVGFDAALFQNKLEINGDYFARNTIEMIAQVQAPLYSGVPSHMSLTSNIGKVSNKGFEISASYREMEGDFRFEVGGYFSKVINNVEDLGGEGVFIASGSYGQGVAPLSRTEAGYPIGSFYGYVTDGIFQSYEEINAHAFQNANTAPGDFRFKDLNGDGVIDGNDQTYIGSPHPDFTYSFNFYLAYKSFDITGSFQGVYGAEILAPYMSFTHNVLSGDYNYHSDLNDAWTEDNPSNTTPRIPMFDVNGNLKLSDYYVHDGSYLRFKSLQVGYNVPDKWLSMVHIDKLRVYFGAQNLLTFTKYIGNDPEIGYNSNSLVINADFGTVPQPRTFTFGIDLNF